MAILCWAAKNSLRGTASLLLDPTRTPGPVQPLEKKLGSKPATPPKPSEEV